MTDASWNTVGEQRYYPYGETYFTSGTIYTDKLFTGQREITGLGICHYEARFRVAPPKRSGAGYSPKLGRFLSADTIVPGAANPQAYNRYSYVLGNPLKFIDPTGHYCVGDDEDCADEAGDGPAPTGTGGNGSGNNGGGNPHDDDDFDPNPNCTDCNIYNPIGDYITGYNGASGGVYTTGISGITGLDGECADFSDPKGCSAIAIAGGNVPVYYVASYDVVLYENLLVLTIHESYAIPEKAPPLYQAEAFGKSTLLSRRGTDRTSTALGNFLPANMVHLKNAPRRDTTLYFLGKQNFPDQLVIQVKFGAAGLGSQTFYYPLPYSRP